MPPLSWQLKLKPKDAEPLKPMLGGSCPPPRPVHAVSTTAKMPAAARKRDPRRDKGARVFIDAPRHGKAWQPRAAEEISFPSPHPENGHPASGRAANPS